MKERNKEILLAITPMLIIGFTSLIVIIIAAVSG